MSPKIFKEIYYVFALPVLFLLVWWVTVEVKASRPNSSSYDSNDTAQPHRTGFHFQPFKNWINDPNGPMYYKGLYHLFYQYNPYAAIWGNISWGHSTSTDLVNWIHLKPALIPDQPYDVNGVWSGSVTFLHGGKPVIYYTGGDVNNSQVQCLATPKNLADPFLREWVKSSKNPLLTPQAERVGADLFRDPSTAWKGYDGEWRVLIGAEVNGNGVAMLYRSADFIQWIKREDLLSSNKTKMWECPDLFPVSIGGNHGLDVSFTGNDNNTKDVLKSSFSGHDYYILGKYDPKTDRYTPEFDFMDNRVKLQYRYDYGQFYASKSFYDWAKKRRILWGWVNELDSKQDDIKRGWAGLQSFPRTILLDKSGGQLVLWPVEEIEKLRGKQVKINEKELKGGSMIEIEGITASQADVELSIGLSNLNEAEPIDQNVNPELLCAQKNASVEGNLGPFGLLVLASNNLTEQTAVFFRVFKSQDKHVVLMCSDQSRSSLKGDVVKPIYGAYLDLDPLQENIYLRSLIDHSIVESFGGEGKTCITARVYPEQAIFDQARLYAFNHGTQSITISDLSAWSMRPAKFSSME